MVQQVFHEWGGTNADISRIAAFLIKRLIEREI